MHLAATALAVATALLPASRRIVSGHAPLLVIRVGLVARGVAAVGLAAAQCQSPVPAANEFVQNPLTHSSQHALRRWSLFRCHMICALTKPHMLSKSKPDSARVQFNHGLLEGEKKMYFVDTPIITDDLVRIVVATHQQLRDFVLYGHRRVVIIDGSHGLTRYGYVLLTLHVVDDFYHGRPICHAIINSESADDVAFVLQALKRRVHQLDLKPDFKPGAFMSDKCAGELRAIGCAYCACNAKSRARLLPESPPNFETRAHAGCRFCSKLDLSHAPIIACSRATLE